MWFRKKATSKSYVVPPVPTDEEIIASAPIRMSPYQNVARGTWGYSVLRLANEGRLKGRIEYGILPDETVYIYEASQ